MSGPAIFLRQGDRTRRPGPARSVSVRTPGPVQESPAGPNAPGRQALGLGAANTFPRAPDSREKEQRPIIVAGEPGGDGLTAAMIAFAEAGLHLDANASFKRRGLENLGR